MIRIVAVFFLLIPGAFAAEAAHGEAEIPFSLVYAAVNFLILMGLLIYLLRRPAKEYFASRATLIRTKLQQAQEYKDHAQKKYEEYEQRLSQIDAEMQRLVASLKEDGDLERERLIQSAREQATALQATTEKILAQELRRAKEELKAETLSLAEQLAEEALRKNITPQDQERMTEQYLKQMEKWA